MLDVVNRGVIQRVDQFYWGSGIAVDAPALTYYLVVSLVPLALGLTGIAAVLLGDYDAAERAATRAAALLPTELRSDFTRLVVDTNRDSPRLIATGLLAMTWTGAGALNVLDRCLARLLDRPRRSTIPGLLRNLALAMLVAVLLVLAAGAATSAGGALGQVPALGLLQAWWAPIVSAACAMAICTALMRVLPRGGMSLKSAVIGALPPTLALQIVGPLLGAFVGSSDLGATRVFLVLVLVVTACYVVAQGLLIGAGLAAQTELRRLSGQRVRLPQIPKPGMGQQPPPRAPDGLPVRPPRR